MPLPAPPPLLPLSPQSIRNRLQLNCHFQAAGSKQPVDRHTIHQPILRVVPFVRARAAGHHQWSVRKLEDQDIPV